MTTFILILKYIALKFLYHPTLIIPKSSSMTCHYVDSVTFIFVLVSISTSVLFQVLYFLCLLFMVLVSSNTSVQY